MLRALLLASGGIPCIIAHGDLQEPLYAEAFTTYAGYTGALSSVSGIVELGRDAVGTQVMFFDLANVDPACDGSPDAKNACGIHVHEGQSCDEDALDHYYSSELTEDPWKEIRYNVSSEDTSKAVGENIRVTTHRSLLEMEGRTIIVHDSAGTRIACALLNHGIFEANKQLTVKSFSSYPDYEGGLTVAGSVIIDSISSAAGAAQVLTFALSGVDPACATVVTGEDNACGIHVHEGGDCENASTIGGHYYNSEAIDEDPWKPIIYMADGSGITKGLTIKVVTAASMEEIGGRTLIVHDATGTRVACGAIPNPWSDARVSEAKGSSALGVPLLLAAVLAYVL